VNDNLFFIGRHGTTHRTEEDRFEGWSSAPDALLDDEGQVAAREMGVWLARLKPEIKHVICSDMGRAIETAAIVCNILGIPEFEINERLRPIHIGDLEGQPKADYDISPYLVNTSKKFPNGENVDSFEEREASVARELIKRIQSGEIKPCTLLVLTHSTIIKFWQRLQSGDKSPQYMHEDSDLVQPGGLVLVTDNEVMPVYKKNTSREVKYTSKDGTSLAGFVTVAENCPPRECWNCKWFSRDIAGGQCDHSLVRIDPELIPRRKDNGQVTVGDRDCCDNFQNHPST
jgi:broad specificity phosphatase PhoE